MKRHFNRLFLIIVPFLLSALSHAIPGHKKTPEIYRDLLVAVYTSDAARAKNAIPKGGITSYGEEFTQLALRIVSLNVMKARNDAANQQEAEDAFTVLKIIVKNLNTNFSDPNNESPPMVGIEDEIQYFLNQNLDQFCGEHQDKFQLSELELAIIKKNLHTIKTLLADQNNQKHKNRVINLCILMLHIQGFKIVTKYSTKKTPLTSTDLTEEDIHIFEIADIVDDAFTIGDRKKNAHLPAKMSAVEFYEKFKNTNQEG